MMLTAFIAGARTARGGGGPLIRALAEARGVAARITRGQLALANALVARAERAAPLLESLGEDMLVRILTGELSPGDAAATEIARATDGAVRPEMFAEAETDEMPAGDPSPGRATRVPEQAAGASTLLPAADPPFVAAGHGHAVICFCDVQVRVPKASLAALIHGLQKAEARLA